MTKGQKVRLFLSDSNSSTPTKVIAAAKQLTLHVSCTFEAYTTKDVDSDYDLQEMTGINYDIRTSALVSDGLGLTGGDDLNNIESLYQSGATIKWEIGNVKGTNNRTKDTTIVSGSCLLTNLSINSPNRQLATYDAQFVGVGDYTVPTSN